MAQGNVGDRVKALHFGPSTEVDDNETVPPGTLGTIDHIDDMGTRHVRWDNGHMLGLIEGHDTWVVVLRAEHNDGTPQGEAAERGDDIPYGRQVE